LGQRAFPFVDATFAAEMLGVPVADVLQWVADGRLTSYGGKERNPFLRTVQVEELGREMGRDPAEPPVRRRASQNPVRRVELRLRHDAKWSDVSEEDLQAWLREADAPSRAAAEKVARTAVDRLNRMLSLLAPSRE